MKKFLSNIKRISEKIYDEIGCIEEKYLQVALSIEFDKLKIPHLRETNIQVYYDTHPLGLFEFDFLIYPHGDLKEHIIIETKLSSKINDDHRQQLKNYLRSAHLNSQEEIKKIKQGLLINFKKVEKYKDGINEIPDEKIEIEVWSYKDNKFGQDK